MGISDGTLLGIIILLATVVGKLAELLIGRFLDSKESPNEKKPGHALHPRFEEGIVKLVEWHDVKDPDGTFVWYFPRHALWDRLEDLDNKIREVREHQLKCGCGGDKK